MHDIIIMQPFLSELCLLLKSCEGEEEVCVEVLGILGNLSLPDMDFHRVVTELDLLPFIMRKLKVHICILAGGGGD